MSKAFNVVTRVVSTVIGIAMILLGEFGYCRGSTWLFEPASWSGTCTGLSYGALLSLVGSARSFGVTRGSNELDRRSTAVRYAVIRSESARREPRLRWRVPTCVFSLPTSTNGAGVIVFEQVEQTAEMQLALSAVFGRLRQHAIERGAQDRSRSQPRP